MTSKMLKTGWLLGILITLHQPDGKPVYINADEIMVVAPADGFFHGASKILIHDQWLSVQESPEQVKFLRDGV